MNSWLAQIYNTGGAADSDLEKTAQSMLLEKLAEAEGVDISGLSQEQLDALAAEVIPADEGQQVQQGQQPVIQTQPQLQQQQGMVAQAGEAPSEEEVDGAQPTEEMAKEAQAKFEEADFLGRVMAHAYTNELEKIGSKTKTAGFGMDVAKGHMRDAGRAIKGGAERAGRAIKGGADQAYGATKSHLSAHKGKYMAGAGGAAAGFGAGRMSKEASIFIEKLAEIRAGEILQQNGIDPATGQALQQQQTQQPQRPIAQAQQTQPSAVAQPQEQVQQAVDNRAVEILKEAGYTIQ